MSYDAVNVYVDLMKSVEDEDASKRELRAMRRTDKVDILLLLRSIVLG